MVETLIDTPEFERKSIREIEQKFIPIFPENLAHYREAAQPVEQFYLSHPSEPFSLRLREKIDTTGDLVYSATLKDRGSIGLNGIDRLEVETSITPEMYNYYLSSETPLVRKLRAQVNNHVSIDFYDDNTVVESEHPIAWQSFIDNHGSLFSDVTGDRQADNEWQAHMAYRRQHQGKEALVPQKELLADDIVRDILERWGYSDSITVHIGGRSGSGKSTIVEQVLASLDSHRLKTIVMSTDDYHRGNTWLEEYNNGQPWIDWDDPIVYDTTQMAADLAKLKAGQTIARRQIDFSTVEPTVAGVIKPAPITIIEGIYANSPDIALPDALNYTMTTGVATCIGRRLLRDMRERPQFADPVKSLRYMLEFAEPRYRAQHNLRQAS